MPVLIKQCFFSDATVRLLESENEEIVCTVGEYLQISEREDVKEQAKKVLNDCEEKKS